MIEEAKINDLVGKIAALFHPHRIILFGSYAKGNARPDSDLDLLVVMDFEGLGARKSAEIMGKTSPRFGVDIVVRTPQEIERRIGLNDFFIKEIIATGKVLYEAPN